LTTVALGMIRGRPFFSRVNVGATIGGL
jgi:hypothetical protein